MTVRKSVEALRDDLNQVTADLATLTSALGNMVGVGTREAKERVSARIMLLQSKSRTLQDSISQSFDDGLDYVEDRVYEKPYHTAIVAGLLSGLVAWLIFRSRD